MLQSQRLVENDDLVFRCTLKNARILLCLLQSINLNEDIILMFTDKGIHFSSEKSKCFQITGYLQKELFSQFDLLENEPFSFKLRIKLFIDSLTSMLTCASSDTHEDKEPTIYQNDSSKSNTSLDIYYGGYGQPLILVLKDEVSTTECSLATQDAENIISFEIKEEDLMSKFIIHSDFFKDVLTEMNWTSEDLQISVDPDFGLVFTTIGQGVTSVRKIRKSSPKLLSVEFKALHTYAYKSKFIKLCLKVLTHAERTCIRIDSNGLLNIEYMVNLFGKKGFVQTYCLPNVDSSI